MNKQLLELLNGESLTEANAQTLFQSMLGGELSDIEISAALTALKMRRETGVEISSLVNLLRERAVKIAKPVGIFADCAGTGGDGLGTFNVSTASALTAAACGLPMLKHGNRASSSPSGSADIIEKMGFDLALDPTKLSALYSATDFAFLFAPAFHPLVGRVMPVRKALATATIFNLAGPLANPAAPPIQLMGVCDKSLLQPMAEVLQRIGCQRGLVVYGAGLDEVAIHSVTDAILVTTDEMTPLSLSVKDFGIPQHDLSTIQLAGDDPITVFEDVIAGRASDAKLQMVAINTAAILWLAGKADSLKTGTEMAYQALKDGLVERKLTAIITKVKQLA